MITVHTATDEQVWPDPSFRPPPAMREEIRREAERITTKDVIDSGSSWAPWYAQFMIAQSRVEERHQRAAQQRQQMQATEDRNAARLDGLEQRLNALTERSNSHFENIKSNFSALFKMFEPISGQPDAKSHIEALIRVVCWEMLQEKRCMRYAGIWDSEKLYAAGATVTMNGATWVAIHEHKGERPGASDSWKLCVKSDVSALKTQVKEAVRDELYRASKVSK